MIPYIVFVVHTLEELPGFAVWATRHFGHETTGMFAAYHIPILIAVLLIGWRAVMAERHGGWVIMALACGWQFAVNALFHLTTWAMFGEYSPGAVTGATVSLPAAAFLFIWVKRESRATGSEMVLAVVIGTVLSVAAIGFLFI